MTSPRSRLFQRSGAVQFAADMFPKSVNLLPLGRVGERKQVGEAQGAQLDRFPSPHLLAVAPDQFDASAADVDG